MSYLTQGLPGLGHKILPDVDVEYTGAPAAYLFLCMVTIQSTFRSLVHMFRYDGGANSIAKLDISNEGG